MSCINQGNLLLLIKQFEDRRNGPTTLEINFYIILNG